MQYEDKEEASDDTLQKEEEVVVVVEAGDKTLQPVFSRNRIFEIAFWTPFR